jgi:type IV pilus assembly protein PilE
MTLVANGIQRSGALGRRSNMLGITLLELMAVVMVIGILGIIALPSYRQYVMRAQRTEAKAALLQLATNQERYYLANRSYGTVAQLQGANLLAGSGGNAFSERGSYQITIAGPSATTYTATATPVAGGAVDMSADAQCATFSITAQGLRTATGSDPARCW